jgi:hypothetical protein
VNQEYASYLKSDHWKALSQARRERDGYQCIWCGSNRTLDVHHVTYERFGDEDLDDLVTVCRDCHKIRHSINPIRDEDWTRIRDEVPDYDPRKSYTQRQIELMAEKILIQDLETRKNQEYPAILLEPHLKARKQHEIYNINGAPDPSIEEGLYWRTHPRGLGWYDKNERKDSRKTGFNSSFYRGSIGSMLRRRHREGWTWKPEPFEPLADDQSAKLFTKAEGLENPDIEKMVRMRKDGRSWAAIGREFGIKAGTVQKKLRKAGLYF